MPIWQRRAASVAAKRQLLIRFAAALTALDAINLLLNVFKHCLDLCLADLGQNPIEAGRSHAWQYILVQHCQCHLRRKWSMTF